MLPEQRIEKGSVIQPFPLSPSSAQASSLCIPLQARALLWAHPDFPRTYYRWPSVVTWSCSVLDVSFLSPRALPLLNAVYCLSFHFLIHLNIPSLSAPQTPPGFCVPEPSSECWVWIHWVQQQSTWLIPVCFTFPLSSCQSCEEVNFSPTWISTTFCFL